MGVNKGTNVLLRKSTIWLATSYIVFSFAYAVLTMAVDNIYFDSNYYSDNFLIAGIFVIVLAFLARYI